MCVVDIKYNHFLVVDMAGVACRELWCARGWCRLFLPCLVAFWGFYPNMSGHFIKMFFVTCFSFFLGGGGYRAIDPDMHICIYSQLLG